jgi:murein DD-endopeptidase MepM/ murein hydrolase activator NlpD
MNPLLFRTILVAFSFKREFKFVLGTFIFILFLPVIAILVLTNAGIPVISNKLALVNLKTNLIAIDDPTGKVIAQIQASTIWPIHGVVTLEFGQPDPPYQPIHTGIDIAGKSGSPITPFMKGTVIDVEHLSWGYGNYVVIDHGNNITSLYGHMSQTAATKGEQVVPGDVIGYEGQTGWATGPHVHFQINVFGIPVNPRTFVEDDP